MPSRIPRPCSVYPCADVAQVKGKCRRHAAEADAARNLGRARSLAVYRSARWRRLRRRILLERPWCEEPSERCHEPATDVDHITPIEDGGDPWDEENLRPLCHRHHSRKTRTIDQPRRRR